MKRINNIYEKIYSLDNLTEAHKKARRSKGHYREVKYVDKHLNDCLLQIQEMLMNETYQIGGYKTKTIEDKGKIRNLMILPYYPDRIIQWAIMLQIEEYFTKTLCYFTCASVKDRGINRAYNLTKRYLKDDPEGTKYCLKIDISKFYDNIDHEILKYLLAKRFKDKKLLRLLNAYVDSVPGEKGIPIGAYLSQYFANFYLAYFDHYLKEDLGIKYIVRYMDDIIIMSDNKEQLHQWRRDIEQYLTLNLKLTLKTNYQIFPVDSRSIDFVGYKFFHHKILLRQCTARTIRKRARATLKRRIIRMHEACMINSYYGITRYYGNCFGFYSKYIFPLLRLARDFRQMFYHHGPSSRQLEKYEIQWFKNIQPDFSESGSFCC